MTTASERVFFDTSFLVAAAVDFHPGHPSARSLLADLADEGAAPCLSLQVCREFMVVLTRAPIGGRIYTDAEALAALEDWLAISTLLVEDGEVLSKWEELVARYKVRGKQLHDCNIVATMLVNDVKRLVTRNAADFQRYQEGLEITQPAV